MKIKTLTWASVALLILGGCASQSKTEADKTDSSSNTTDSLSGNWTKLFDGKTTAGWHTYGKDSAGKGWTAVDGALAFDPAVDDSQRGDLVTNKAYTNFHLKLDWKISPAGNSGIIYLVQDDAKKYPATYFTGPEMQVLDNDGHPDGKLIRHRAGDLYDLISSSKETVKPVGEWNTAEVKINKDTLTYTLNGTEIVKTMLHDQKWKDMVAKSKFHEWADFGTFSTGHIALQDHGNKVWYRNIMIEEL